MAKRNNRPTRANGTAAANASDATTAEAMEQRVTAFAEQLGRMAGTIQAKAEGWMDRETLNEQIAGVRDGAARAPKKKAAVAVARQGQGRSGDVVDAPGKKHRKQAPADPDATIARNQAAKLRTAMPMAKIARHIVTTASVPPMTSLTSVGRSDSTTEPASQNQDTISMPSQSRGSA